MSVTRAAPRSEIKLRERAYDEFTHHLLRSNIKPGQFVSQRELVALTGQPLGAIRELIPRLETEGLIVTVPQRVVDTVAERAPDTATERATDMAPDRSVDADPEDARSEGVAVAECSAVAVS